ncbi:hypothetical protein, partial [Acinetobacter baumannii]|uniref:hypothetical protein n=1 Tax=Acinetobacter baumannii TaxID=470 RepID=UPI001C097379
HTREQELWRRLLYSGRISYLRQDYRDIRGGNALMVAGSLRYVLPTQAALRPFAEIGGWVTPSASFHFNRDCPNGLGVARG